MRFIPNLFICAAISASPLSQPTSTAGIASRPVNVPSGTRRTTGRHIFQLKPTVSANEFDREFISGLEAASSEGASDNTVVYRYSAHKGAFNGYAGVFSQAILDALKQDDRIASVEEDVIGHIDAVQKSPADWGLARISERKLDLSQDYTYDDKAGQGITVYVLDTGIDLQHSEFTGRISFGANFISGEAPDDLEGHGSHVAGIAVGSTYGVAKKANVVAVKVCDQYGDCATSDIIAGLQWVLSKAKKLQSVVNMSLGVDASDQLDAMVLSVKNAGIPVIVSAGNGNTDACIDSPRRSAGAFPVAATDNTDRMMDESNYGKCVKLCAPGVDIVSAAPGGGTDVRQGTSQAAPNVAGIAALYMAASTYASVDAVYSNLQSRATKGAVVSPKPDTANLMAYSLMTN